MENKNKTAVTTGGGMYKNVKVTTKTLDVIIFLGIAALAAVIAFASIA